MQGYSTQNTKLSDLSRSPQTTQLERSYVPRSRISWMAPITAPHKVDGTDYGNKVDGTDYGTLIPITTCANDNVKSIPFR